MLPRCGVNGEAEQHGIATHSAASFDESIAQNLNVLERGNSLF
jgi:hypothetical protein